ncbi:MAG: tRNA (adenosine(37)-N6)-threonylcarbamoyltransferase complex dimerization subunit type 1 TsaB [Proteobacteria bacterium]|nr:tRNA (adenosine(37)-N6)-threonylcarbamoyltransferase complex dimerization subunit type 1 TsaB [Pseudomonadota bacterium]
MNLLAIETSTENCSVGIFANHTIYQKSVIAPRKHAELVLPAIEDLLIQAKIAKKDLDGIVFGQGPGAFTGVRIAVSIVQGLALALDIPVLGVSTLETMAYNVYKKLDTKPGSHILIANDARMGEAYHASFFVDGSKLIRLTADQVSKPEKINTSGANIFAGNAFTQFESLRNKLPKQAMVFADLLPQAKYMLLLAQPEFKQHSTDITAIQAVYVRDKVVFN